MPGRYQRRRVRGGKIPTEEIQNSVSPQIARKVFDVARKKFSKDVKEKKFPTNEQSYQ